MLLYQRWMCSARIPRPLWCTSNLGIWYHSSSFSAFLVLGLLHISQACFIILSSSTFNTCPNHLSLLCLMISSNVFNLVPPCDSHHHWNLWCAASNFFFCVTVKGHSSALYSSVDITNDSYNFTLTGKLIYLPVSYTHLTLPTIYSV